MPIKLQVSTSSAQSMKVPRRTATSASPFHEHDPAVFRDRLGFNPPPLLCVAGDPAWLADPHGVRLGIVGSRDASEAEFEVAREAAEAAALPGWVVVSGAARGMDAVGLNVASAAGGSVVAIMSEGLRRTLRKGALRRLVTDEAALLVSAARSHQAYRDTLCDGAVPLLAVDPYRSSSYDANYGLS